MRLSELSLCVRIRFADVNAAECGEVETQKASAGEPLEALQIKLVAGTGFEPVTFRL